jgi:dienelactone hydrolase
MTVEEWQALRPDLYAKLATWCGDLPERGELNPREVWRREYSTHTEIKLTYQGEPGERIPAYLLIPRTDASSPLPTVYAAHQCAWQCDIGKEQVVGKSVDWPDQAYGLELVRQGFVVLAPDANKVGERYDPELRQPWETASTHKKGQGCCCTAPGGSWGPIRWKPVYDVMRGVDLLCQHERVDANRIGMIGHSLGADTTIWAMPFESRIRAAAVSGGGLMIYGRWLPYGLPYEDVLKLIAPRPFLEVTGAWDDANWKGCDKPRTVDEAFAQKRRALAVARQVYAAYGQAERLDAFEFEGAHTFPQAGREAAYAWLSRWLGDDGLDNGRGDSCLPPCYP